MDRPLASKRPGGVAGRLQTGALADRPLDAPARVSVPAATATAKTEASRSNGRCNNIPPRTWLAVPPL